MDWQNNKHNDQFDCSIYNEQISLYLDNAMDEADTAAFRRLMTEHPALAEQVDAMQIIINSLHDLEDIPLPEGFHEELMHQLKIQQQPANPRKAPAARPRFFTVPWKRYSAVAASLVAFCIVLTATLQSIGSDSNRSSIPGDGMEMAGIAATDYADINSDSITDQALEKGIIMDVPANDGQAVTGTGYADIAPAAGEMEATANHPSSDQLPDTGISANGTPAAAEAPMARSFSAVQAADDPSAAKQAAPSDVNSIAVRSYSLTLRVDNSDLAAETLAAYSTYIVSRDVSFYSDYSYTNTALSVPAEQYEGIIAQLKYLGQVQNEYESETIIAFDIMDTKATLRAREKEYGNLMVLLGKAEKIEDMLAVETRLDQLNTEITGYKNNLLLWNNQRDYPYIYISLETGKDNTKYAAPAQNLGRQMQESFMESANGLIIIMENTAMALSYIIFPAMAVTVVILVLYLVIKAARRREP